MIPHDTTLDILDNVLVISKQEEKKTVKFPFTIAQVETFEKSVVVRLEIPIDVIFNDNIFGVSYHGKILWQIPSLNHVVYSNSPFTGMGRHMDDSVELHNFDGTDLFVNSETGKIIAQEYSK